MCNCPSPRSEKSTPEKSGAYCHEQKRRKEIEGKQPVAERMTGQSAPETGLKHANDGVLPGDHLCLVNQNDRHYAHGKNAERQDNACLGLCCGNMKYAPYQVHNLGLLQLERANGPIPIC